MVQSQVNNLITDTPSETQNFFRYCVINSVDITKIWLWQQTNKRILITTAITEEKWPLYVFKRSKHFANYTESHLYLAKCQTAFSTTTKRILSTQELISFLSYKQVTRNKLGHKLTIHCNGNRLYLMEKQESSSVPFSCSQCKSIYCSCALATLRQNNALA